VKREPQLKVWPIDDGGPVVRGTLDVDVARAAVLKHLVDGGQIHPDDVDGYDLVVSRAGMFRWNPCRENNCWDGGGHCGHIAYVDAPGPGVWPGVLFK
jgi:hypothetical protein